MPPSVTPGQPVLRTGSCPWPSLAGATLDRKPPDRGTRRAALRAQIGAKDAQRWDLEAPVHADLWSENRSTFLFISCIYLNFRMGVTIDLRS